MGVGSEERLAGASVGCVTARLYWAELGLCCCCAVLCCAECVGLSNCLVVLVNCIKREM